MSSNLTQEDGNREPYGSYRPASRADANNYLPRCSGTACTGQNLVCRMMLRMVREKERKLNN